MALMPSSAYWRNVWHVAAGFVPLWARASLKAICTALVLMGSAARCIASDSECARSAQPRPGEGKSQGRLRWTVHQARSSSTMTGARGT